MTDQAHAERYKELVNCKNSAVAYEIDTADFYDHDEFPSPPAGLRAAKERTDSARPGTIFARE